MVPKVGGGVYPGCMPSGGSRRVDIRVHEQIDQLSRRSWSKKLVQEVGPRSRRRLSTGSAALLKNEEALHRLRDSAGSVRLPVRESKMAKKSYKQDGDRTRSVPATVFDSRRATQAAGQQQQLQQAAQHEQPTSARGARQQQRWLARETLQQAQQLEQAQERHRRESGRVEREEQRQQQQQRHQQRQQQAGEERAQASREEPLEQPAERRLWWWSLARWGQAADSIGCQWPPCSTCGAPWRPLFALSCLCCRVTVPVRNIVDCMRDR